MKAYQSIPVIVDFKNDTGEDNLKQTIDANYKTIKQDILALVDSEIERIKNDESLCHLIKEKEWIYGEVLFLIKWLPRRGGIAILLLAQVWNLRQVVVPLNYSHNKNKKFPNRAIYFCGVFLFCGRSWNQPATPMAG